MAFECIKSTFAKRLYEEGEVYPDIGEACKKHFVQVRGAPEVEETEVEETEVIETSGEDGGDQSDEDDAVSLLKSELDVLDAKYPEDATAEELEELLAKARSAKLTV